MNDAPRSTPLPIWDRGEPIDAEMLAFTSGDDWLWDRRLVDVDLSGSLAHAEGLFVAGLLSPDDYAAIRAGLEALRAAFSRGEWTVEPGDEDVHSAVERRLIERIGEPGKRLHTGRSRNDQIALDVRLWLRSAIEASVAALDRLVHACAEHGRRNEDLALPGYTHLRRAMPSTVSAWAAAYAQAFRADGVELAGARARIARSPLGSGAGYGVPLPLAREHTARVLGFEGPEEPVTLSQLSRGRAELAYVTALEGVALDLGKLAADLWLFSTTEFGFVRLPTELTTGSSLMPHKRNPDLLELVRGHARQVGADRAALVDVVRDLPSGYHRDFQLVKPPLFRAHDRVLAMLPLAAKLLAGLAWDPDTLARAASDPVLQATERVLQRAVAGVTFRDAYREASRDSG